MFFEQKDLNDCIELFFNEDIVDSRTLEKEKARKRYKDNIRYKQKLEREYKNLGHCYPGYCYPKDKYRNYTNDKDKIVYYKKISKSSHATRYSYFKNYSNRRVRKYFKVLENIEDIEDIYIEDDKISLGKKKGNYRKVFDYKWSVD